MTTKSSGGKKPLESRGRRVVLEEPWTKTDLRMFNRHLAYLKEMNIKIRLKHKRTVKPPEMIRLILESIIQSGIDLSEKAGSNKEIVAWLAEKLRDR